MGFTRYWKQPHGIDPITWKSIVADTRKLLDSVDVSLMGGAGGRPEAGEVISGLPLLIEGEIVFNGPASESGEWFILRPAPSDFECIKTNSHPYDVVVAAVLIIAKHHAPAEILNVESDDAEGRDKWSAWEPALQMCGAADIAISRQSVRRLKADVAGTSKEYEPPKSEAEQEISAEWERMWRGDLLKLFCEKSVPPTYLRYQATVPVGLPSVKLQLRRSIDARSLPPTSPILLAKAAELQAAWNQDHRIQIVEIEIG